MDSKKCEKMESKSQCEVQHPNPLMPHYALSEGILRLETSPIQNSDSEHSGGLVASGVGAEESRSQNGIGSRSGISSVGRGDRSGTSTTTMKADDDEDDEGNENELTRRDDPCQDDEDDYKDPNRVHFQNLSRAYTPEDDIFLIYELGDDIDPSASDWLAILPWSILVHAISAASEALEGAASTSADSDNWTPEMSAKSLWREAAPQASTNRDFPNLRSIFVNLSSKSIPPSDSLLYAFVFVSASTNRIIGISTSFNISDKPFIDTEVKDITSILEVLVDVGDIPELDPGSLKHLKSFMEPVQHQSEPDCVVSFKRRPQTTTEERQQQQRLLRPAGRMRIPEAEKEKEEEEEEEEAQLCPWDPDGSVEDLLSKSLKMLESVSTMDSFMTVPSESDKGSFQSLDGAEGGGGECPTCSGYKEGLEQMRKLQEESQQQIAEIQQKLKEGKEKLAAAGSELQSLGSDGSESSSLRARKLEEKLRNLRLSKRRLEDELVEAIGRAARSKEEVMEIRQTLLDNTNDMECNLSEMAELKTTLASKEKELKDLHEYVESIHYTLSTKGLKGPKKGNGDDVKGDDAVNENKLVDLDSEPWSISENRRKGALRAKLMNQSGVIDHLHHTLGRLDKERGEALKRAEKGEKTIDVQSIEISRLKEAQAKMKQEAARAANRVESLSKIIIQERQTLQTRMEKVREALQKVDSARKLKLSAGNNDREATGGAGGGGWASGSDRAAAAAATAARSKMLGQQPKVPPDAAPTPAGGGGAVWSGKSRFVSPSSTPPPHSGAALFAATTLAPSNSSERMNGRGRHQPEPIYTFIAGEPDEPVFDRKEASKSVKGRRKSQSRDRGHRCPICREAFSPVANKAAIQSHINSHNQQNRDPHLGGRPISEDESGYTSGPREGNSSKERQKKWGEGKKDAKKDAEEREGKNGEKKGGKKEGRFDFSSSREKVAGLTRKWNSFAGNGGKSSSTGFHSK